MTLDKVLTIARSVLSFIAIAAVVGLGYYESKAGEQVSIAVYIILGGAVFGANAKEVLELIGFFKK